jgi:2-haloacid dehalogenase
MARFGDFALILFDADNTLFDFSASEQAALVETLAERGHDRELALGLLPTYREISRGLWHLLEQGRITPAELRTERFRRLFATAGLKGDPERAGNDYLANLARGTHLMEGALEVCRELKARGLRLGIVTNGFKRVQEPRFRASPLASLIDWLVISEDFGIAKPDPRIFEHAIALAEHSDKATALFVGDRLESDILGAENAGIVSCWFNPGREPNGSGIRPAFEIRQLTELLI